MIGIWLIAPALVFSTVAFTWTFRLDGIIIPSTPAQTQVLIIAPKLWESSTPSRMTSEAFSYFFLSKKSSKSIYLIGEIWAIIPWWLNSAYGINFSFATNWKIIPFSFANSLILFNLLSLWIFFEIRILLISLSPAINASITEFLPKIISFVSFVIILLPLQKLQAFCQYNLMLLKLFLYLQ